MMQNFIGSMFVPLDIIMGFTKNANLGEKLIPSSAPAP